MDKNIPAFPSHGSMGEVVQEGMPLRDWFAGQALESAIKFFKFDMNLPPKIYASFAYKIADAMLEEREKNKE